MNTKHKPILTLPMYDKIYLAVAKKSAGKLSFVYTLACLNDGTDGTWLLKATHEIHTFQNEESANLYHDTIEQIVEENENDETKKAFFDFNKKQVDHFAEKFCTLGR